MARIASLHFYPVKSCRGITVEAFRLTDTGPEWDRRWMIVTAAGGPVATGGARVQSSGDVRATGVVTGAGAAAGSNASATGLGNGKGHVKP